MKILLIDVNCKHSSTGKIVYDLFQRLKQDGHEAAICYGRGELIKEAGIYKFGLEWETKLHAGLARLTGLNGYYSHFSTQRLIKFIDKFKPDVIHIHELHAYFVNIKPLIEHIKKQQIKVVWTFHCEYMYTGKCGYTYTCLNYRTGCGNCPAVKDYPKSLFFDRTKRMFVNKKKLLIDWDFNIVVPSRWLKNKVNDSFLEEKNKVVIYNGIDTEGVFYPRNTEKLRMEYGLQEKKIVLAVAPDIMSQRKGGTWVVQMAKRMPYVIFILIGVKNSKEIFPENIIAIPQLENMDKLATFYSMADLFLLCSEKETFSMTCAEALCCGTPIVGFKCGAPETVFSEPYATFVDFGDLDALEDAVSRRIDANWNKKGIGKISGEIYSRQVMYKAYLAEYKMIL